MTSVELENAIRANRGEVGPCLVYADWLQAQGSPAGEWIALAAALEVEPDRKKQARLDELTRGLELPSKDYATWETQHGLFRWLRLENSADWMAEDFDALALAQQLFALPLCVGLDELRIGILRWDHNYTDVPAVIGAARAYGWAKSLSRLHLGDVTRDIDMAHHVIGPIGEAITSSVPGLRSLELHSSAQEWRGTGETFSVDGLALPALEELVIETCSMTTERLQGVLSAKLPKLTTLKLWFGGRERDATATVANLEKLLDATAFPTITKLGLVNQEFGAELIEPLASSKLAAQLVSLDLSMSTLDSTTAPLLAEIADRFPKLEVLDVSDNFLASGDIAALTAAFEHARVLGGAQDKRQYAEENYRYASVTE